MLAQVDYTEGDDPYMAQLREEGQCSELVAQLKPILVELDVCLGVTLPHGLLVCLLGLAMGRFVLSETRFASP